MLEERIKNLTVKYALKLRGLKYGSKCSEILSVRYKVYLVNSQGHCVCELCVRKRQYIAQHNG